MDAQTRQGIAHRLMSTRAYRVVRALFLCYLALSFAGAPRNVMYYWGLPDPTHYFSYHPDEIFLLLPSFGFAQGDWNPHFFSYGTLYIYLVGIPAVILGQVPDPSRFPTDLRPLYELGRAVSVWMGVATLFLLYFSLRREGRWLAFLSAAFLAVCPLHVVTSGYATVDVPATFFIVTAFWLALWGAGRPDAKRGALVGLAVGLAAATKYNAGLFIIPALLSPLLVRPATWRPSWLAAGIGGAALGFIIGCPFFWTKEFVRGVLFEAQHAQVGGTFAFVGTGSGWAYHLTHGLPVALGYPLLAAAAFGVIAALRLPSRAARLSLVWVVFYLLVIGFSKERFIRYLVPVTPALCVLAASFVTYLYSRRPKVLRVLACALVLLVMGLTLSYAMLRAPVVRPSEVEDAIFKACWIDPRDLAWQTISDLVNPPQSRFRVGLVQAPWYFHPPVSPFNAGPFSKPWFDKWNQETGSRVVITGWDSQKLLAERPAFFFLSDLESQDLIRLRDPAAVGFVSTLDRLYQKKVAYERPGPTKWGWLVPPRSLAPPDWLYPDPRITMYYKPRPKEP